MITKRKTTTIGLAIVLLLSTMGFKCGGEDRLKTYNKTVNTVAEAEVSVATFFANAKETGTLSQADIDAVKPFLIAVNDANREAIKIGREMIDNPSENNRTKLLTSLTAVSAAVVRLNNAGLLRIKDPQKRLVFSTLITTLTGAISSTIVIVSKGE